MQSQRPQRQFNRRGRPASEFSDRDIKCGDCGDHFIWTASEQEYYRDKGLRHTPKRCHQCRGRKKRDLAASAVKPNEARERIEVRVSCARCGVSTTVPFYPSQNKPVYCKSCYLARQGARG